MAEQVTYRRGGMLGLSRSATGGMLPAGMAPSGNLSAYQPTLRERTADIIRKLLFSDDREGQGRAERVMDVASMTPLGVGMDVYDAGREAGMGNLGTAGVMLGMAAMPGPGPKGNRREILGHLEGAQPQDLQPSVQSVNSPAMKRLSSKELESLLERYFPGFRRSESQSITDRHGPSASLYYHVDTPEGVKTIRLSDHTYGDNNALDFRYWDYSDVAEKELLEKFGLEVPPDLVQRAETARMLAIKEKWEFNKPWRAKDFANAKAKIKGLRKAKNLTPEQKEKAISRIVRDKKNLENEFGPLDEISSGELKRIEGQK